MTQAQLLYMDEGIKEPLFIDSDTISESDSVTNFIYISLRSNSIQYYQYFLFFVSFISCSQLIVLDSNYRFTLRFIRFSG